MGKHLKIMILLGSHTQHILISVHDANDAVYECCKRMHAALDESNKKRNHYKNELYRMILLFHTLLAAQQIKLGIRNKQNKDTIDRPESD